MGRRYIYYCDNCKTDFGNLIHINIKNGQVYVSYPKKEELDPSFSEWAQREVPAPCKEYHFCSGKCLGEFVDKKIADLLEKLHKVKVEER